jgi:hypothetical protein
VGGRRALALGSLLIGVGSLGVVLGRSSVNRSPVVDENDAPPVASTRVADELTDTTPLAAVPPEEPPAPIVEPAPAFTAPLVTTAAPPPVPPAAPAPAPAAPPPAPAVVAPPPVLATPIAPAPPAPGLVQQGRFFDANAITSSSFDEDDVTEYDPVPDHEVTSSSFDDADRRDSHPTGD